MPLSPHKKPQKQDEEAFARDFLGWNGTLQSLANFRKDIKNYKYWVSIITSRKHTEWHQAKKEMPRTPLPLLKLFKENLISLFPPPLATETEAEAALFSGYLHWNLCSQEEVAPSSLF